MLIYKCNTCDNILDDERKITLGSNNKTLMFENPIKTEDRKIITIGRYSDLHFCKKECFINYFFKLN